MDKLEHTISELQRWIYFMGDEALNVFVDAIELLKEQQPKKTKKVVEEYGWLFGDCPLCGSRLNNKDYPKACGKCGQALEWDGEQE